MTIPHQTESTAYIRYSIPDQFDKVDTNHNIHNLSFEKVNCGKGREIFAPYVKIGCPQFETSRFANVTYKEMFKLCSAVKNIQQYNNLDYRLDSESKIENIIHNCFNQLSKNRKVLIYTHSHYYTQLNKAQDSYDNPIS